MELEGQPRDILFEPSRRAADPGLAAAIRKLSDGLEAGERRLGLRQRARTFKARQGFRLAVEALACNCLVVAVYGAGASLALPASNGAVWARRGMGGGVYGDGYLHAITIMAHPEVGLVERVKLGGFHRGGPKLPELSTIRPAPGFLAAIGGGPYGWHSLRRDETDREVLVLRSAKDAFGEAEALSFIETPARKALRNTIIDLNKWFATAPVFVLGDGVLDRHGRPLDPTDRAVRRIFNNANWHHGGRLYGGFWQSMRREDRPRHLRIRSPQSPEGEPLASVDYGQLFVRLAYQQARVEPPEGDLYDIFGDGSCRAGVKRLVNSMLFRPGALNRWPKDTRPLFPADMKLATIREAIHAKHPGLADIFGTEAGYRFMSTESEALIFVLRSLRREGVYALPLHDAVLVAQSQADIALEAMTVGVRENLGVELRASVTIAESPAP